VKKILLGLFFFLVIHKLEAKFFLCYIRDTSFVKSYFSSSAVKVPENKVWFINKVFISGGDGYNLKISNSNFKSSYKAGEIITFPYYIAEMELITDKNMISYLIYLTEKDTEK